MLHPVTLNAHIVELLCSGVGPHTIARKMNIPVRTIKARLHKMYNERGIKDDVCKHVRLAVILYEEKLCSNANFRFTKNLTGSYPKEITLSSNMLSKECKIEPLQKTLELRTCMLNDSCMRSSTKLVSQQGWSSLCGMFITSILGFCLLPMVNVQPLPPVLTVQVENSPMPNCTNQCIIGAVTTNQQSCWNNRTYSNQTVNGVVCAYTLPPVSSLQNPVGKP